MADTGIGITPEAMSGLFEPFTQAEMSTTRRFGGTGLGLSISQRLAEMLGGKIQATSEPGKGSVFILTIDPGSLDDVPMIEGPTEVSVEEREPDTDRKVSNVGGRVLLADDNQEIQQFVSLVLRQSGLQVDLAGNGREACEKAAASRAEGKPYDLILMDMRMPELDGYKATRRLRQDGWIGPIIALTAYAMAGDREKCLEAGCDDYIAKPSGPRELRKLIARHLSLATDKSIPRVAPRIFRIRHGCP